MHMNDEKKSDSNYNYLFYLFVLLERRHKMALRSSLVIYSTCTLLLNMGGSSALSVSKETMYKDVKGIIFDIDGTLADSWKLGYTSTAVILEKNGIPPITDEIYHECTRYATPERLARHHGGHAPGTPEFERVGAQLGKEFDDLYVDLVDLETAGFYAGIENLLQNLPRHVKLGALTNAAVLYAHAVLETNCPVASNQSQEGGIYDRFESIHGADTVPKPKPSPDGLLKVCAELGLHPTDCVYIGDSPSDGAAAKACDMPAIGVLWGSHKEESLRKAPFTHLCKSVEDLEALLPIAVQVN
jgi:phosphoglycolate phosphatase-like HAD superfamily hydrolase